MTVSRQGWETENAVERFQDKGIVGIRSGQGWEHRRVQCSSVFGTFLGLVFLSLGNVGIPGRHILTLIINLLRFQGSND